MKQHIFHIFHTALGKGLSAGLLCLVCLFGSAQAAELDKPIRVAFLDSGISLVHLDSTRVEKGKNFIFPDRDTDDRVGHGTATAGMVLGSEELGLAGVCPSATVVPLVCYDLSSSGNAAPGSLSAMAQAIRAAVEEYDCQIINISMGTMVDDPDLREAVRYAQEKGALIVSAVGNDNQTAPNRVYYPAAYEGVIGVGSADGAEPAVFSQRNQVDVLAQGVGLETVTNQAEAEVRRCNGTSYSCAYISGVCAALWSASPDWTAEEVREALFHMAQDIGQPGHDEDSGWGVVNLEQSRAVALGQLTGVPEGETLSGAALCRSAVRKLPRLCGAAALCAIRT